MIVVDPTTAGRILPRDISKITDWTNKWLVNFNPSKSESLKLSRKRSKPAHSKLFKSVVEIP